MTPLAPFTYPSVPHVRRHGPSGYSDYKNYKEWLRDEFTFRCVYCLFRERWSPVGAACLSVDHLEPKSQAPARDCDYENLVCACVRCNYWKGVKRVLDPCANTYDGHLRMREDGCAEALTEDGRILIEQLGLNDPPILGWRCRWIDTLRRILAAGPPEMDLLVQWFGYPDDLPDLAALRPPNGNTRPEGIYNSCHARRRRGDLPALY